MDGQRSQPVTLDVQSKHGPNGPLKWRVGIMKTLAHVGSARGSPAFAKFAIVSQSQAYEGYEASATIALSAAGHSAG
jgi:hypothetical protein